MLVPTGCTGFGPRIVVVVDSSLTVPAELDRIEVSAGPPGEPPTEIQGIDLVADGVDAGAGAGVALPTSFVVAPRQGRTAVEVRIEGAVGRTSFTTRTIVVTDLAPNEARVLHVDITRDCDACPSVTVPFRDLPRIRAPGDELDATRADVTLRPTDRRGRPARSGGSIGGRDRSPFRERSAELGPCVVVARAVPAGTLGVALRHDL